MTNREKIHAMSDEELAAFFARMVMCWRCPAKTQNCKDACRETWVNFLQREAKQ